ncbi:MAG TPA: YebC/PmpR family DNA-binding transcriptional regulator [Petrotogaceae bacterium]|jgi:YebC/PmpR family DNA-binding regulatory protein|nr:YebC/PmpR family DNA-binding transcriptional regulator [Petrotogaceae bacterium]HQF32820.1 YebC/PmpR family DNA-binding transcriptional regulator [Petrotogaceae bacterium]HQH32843.1 YebC/PmpR family DNA-binding transcriptional regulator [Petrotogaceae bacterium]HQI78238.1 YebC/PmpR family DNA-binding transcriptional regulator [Petrotogaceae bacterium]
MSGHNKWANIKHRKGAQDAKRSQMFTKIIRELTVAAREGGAVPDSNPRLRTAIEKARDANMPKDKIESAINKGVGAEGADALVEIMYEGYGPSGVALIISVVTDNKNRTAQEIRHILSRHGGALAENGAVSWNFERKAVLEVPKNEVTDSDAFLLTAIDAGAEDVDDSDDPVEVVGPVESLGNMRNSIQNAGFTVKAQLSYLPKTTVKVTGSDAEKLLKLLDSLDDNDDVQEVFGNYEIDEAEMEKLAQNM